MSVIGFGSCAGLHAPFSLLKMLSFKPHYNIITCCPTRTSFKHRQSSFSGGCCVAVVHRTSCRCLHWLFLGNSWGPISSVIPSLHVVPAHHFRQYDWSFYLLACFVCVCWMRGCAVVCSGTHLQPDIHGSWRSEATAAQADPRTWAWRLRVATEQVAAEHHISAQGQRRH